MSSPSVLVLCFSFFLVFSTVTAFNITQILSNQSDFSSFNDFLTRTQLAQQINSRQTITVLVVDNAQFSALSSRPMDFVKKILSMHVILDYFDVAKLQQLPNKTTTLTTLYQASGTATAQQGFLNATDADGKVLFGSASKGSNLNSNLVRSVYALPYNISVLQVSAAIVPGGASNSPSPSPSPIPRPSSSPAPAAAPRSAPTPASAPSSKIAPSPANAPSSNKAPAPSRNISPAPSNIPSASPSGVPSVSPAPGPANSLPPASDIPASSPPAAVGPTPADAPAADSPGSGASGIGGTGIGVAVGLVVFSFVW